MSFGVSFSSLSLFYSILLTITYFKKRRAKNYETKLYGWLIITNLIGLVLAIACYFFVLNKETYEIANFIISRFYLIYLTTWIMILTMYDNHMVYSKFYHFYLTIKLCKHKKFGIFIWNICKLYFLNRLPI